MDRTRSENIRGTKDVRCCGVKAREARLRWSKKDDEYCISGEGC